MASAALLKHHGSNLWRVWAQPKPDPNSFLARPFNASESLLCAQMVCLAGLRAGPGRESGSRPLAEQEDVAPDGGQTWFLTLAPPLLPEFCHHQAARKACLIVSLLLENTHPSRRNLWRVWAQPKPDPNSFLARPFNASESLLCAQMVCLAGLRAGPGRESGSRPLAEQEDVALDGGQTWFLTLAPPLLPEFCHHQAARKACLIVSLLLENTHPSHCNLWRVWAQPKPDPNSFLARPFNTPEVTCVLRWCAWQVSELGLDVSPGAGLLQSKRMLPWMEDRPGSSPSLHHSSQNFVTTKQPGKPA